jgi:mRNA interferase RelE/StbE
MTTSPPENPSDMYEVLLERNAEKELRRLPSKVHDRIIEAIAALGTVPRPPGCRKLAGSKSDWRIRVGDYRVVYEIADSVRIIRVHRVRHRNEAYR